MGNSNGSQILSKKRKRLLKYFYEFYITLIPKLDNDSMTMQKNKSLTHENTFKIINKILETAESHNVCESWLCFKKCNISNQKIQYCNSSHQYILVGSHLITSIATENSFNKFQYIFTI